MSTKYKNTLYFVFFFSQILKNRGIMMMILRIDVQNIYSIDFFLKTQNIINLLIPVRPFVHRFNKKISEFVFIG